MEYGSNQTIHYLSEKEQLFVQLMNNPIIGRPRTELKKEIYSIAIEKHVVFYQKQKDFILIIRILHSRMDIPKISLGLVEA